MVLGRKILKFFVFCKNVSCVFFYFASKADYFLFLLLIVRWWDATVFCNSDSNINIILRYGSVEKKNVFFEHCLKSRILKRKFYNFYFTVAWIWLIQIAFTFSTYWVSYKELEKLFLLKKVAQRDSVVPNSAFISCRQRMASWCLQFP